MRLKRHSRRQPRSLRNSLRSVRLSRIPRNLSLCELTERFLIAFQEAGPASRLTFAAPLETGSRARCEAQRTKGAEASRRFRQLVDDGGLDLTQIPCARPRGTEGTPRCNYGRSCGVLAVRSKDLAEIMIGEGLARRYVCESTKCSKREKCCGGGEIGKAKAIATATWCRWTG